MSNAFLERLSHYQDSFGICTLKRMLMLGVQPKRGRLSQGILLQHIFTNTIRLRLLQT